jgi:protoheme IX farnesyltransferase
VTPSEALSFGLILVLLGVSLLAWQVNLLTGFLSLLTVFLYVLVYTPLKRVTWWNTVIGAIPGALPPMGGWAAATGSLDLGAWVLFLILFVWQHPHFYAIAWMYREDYKRGGFKMLPVVEPDGRSTFRQVIWFSVVLVPVSLLPGFLGMAGAVYTWGMAVLSLGMLWYGVVLARTHSVQDARVLLKVSVIYLPLFFILILGDSSL